MFRNREVMQTLESKTPAIPRLRGGVPSVVTPGSLVPHDLLCFQRATGPHEQNMYQTYCALSTKMPLTKSQSLKLSGDALVLRN